MLRNAINMLNPWKRDVYTQRRWSCNGFREKEMEEREEVGRRAKEKKREREKEKTYFAIKPTFQALQTINDDVKNTFYSTRTWNCFSAPIPTPTQMGSTQRHCNQQSISC